MKNLYKTVQYGFCFMVVLCLLLVLRTPELSQAADTIEIDYVNEVVKIYDTATPDATYFYCNLATASTRIMRNNKYKEAAVVVEGGVKKAYIDFSSLLSSKPGYLGYVKGLDVQRGETAPIVIKVAPSAIRVVAKMNYQAENITHMYEAINSLRVTDPSNQVIQYTCQNGVYYSGTQALPASLVEWRKGANGVWKSMDMPIGTYEYEAMKKSGTTIYVRLAGSNTAKCRASKEAKVKLPQPPNFPTMRVNYINGTVNLKSGMEFFSPTGTRRFVLLPYNNLSTDTINTFIQADAYKIGMGSDLRVSSMSIEEIISMLGINPADTQFDLRIRNCATINKIPSEFATLTVMVPATISFPANLITRTATDVLVQYTFSVDPGECEFLLVKGDKVGITAPGVLVPQTCQLDVVRSRWQNLNLKDLAISYPLGRLVTEHYAKGSSSRIITTAAEYDYMLIRRKGTDAAPPSQIAVLQLQ